MANRLFYEYILSSGKSNYTWKTIALEFTFTSPQGISWEIFDISKTPTVMDTSDVACAYGTEVLF